MYMYEIASSLIVHLYSVHVHVCTYECPYVYLWRLCLYVLVAETIGVQCPDLRIALFISEICTREFPL